MRRSRYRPRRVALRDGREVTLRAIVEADAMWIADLLALGLIRSSFVPPEAIQELRDLTRTRKQLVREISQHSLRIQQVLEDATARSRSETPSVRTVMRGITYLIVVECRAAGICRGGVRTP